MKKRWTTTNTAVLMALVLTLSLCTGCGIPSWTGAETISVSKELSSMLKEKYGEEDLYVFDEPMYDLPQNQILIYDIGFDPYEIAATEKWGESGQESNDFNRIVDIFLDIDLTISADPNIWYNDVSGEMWIEPPNYPAFGDNYALSVNWSSDDKDTRYGIWGFAHEYYAAKFYGPDGEKLDKPIITIFTVQNDIEAPEVEYFVDEGCLGFRWEPIADVDTYRFLHMEIVEEDGKPGYEEIMSFPVGGSEYIYSDIWFEGAMMNGFIGGSDGPYFFCIQAVRDGWYSPVSLPVMSKDIEAILPYMAVDGTTRIVDTINELGIYQNVTMLDDNNVLMPVSYDIYAAGIIDVSTTNQYVHEQKFLLYIPFEVSGTMLKGEAYVRSYNEETLGEDLRMLKQREQDVLSNYGLIQPRMEFDRSGDLDRIQQALQPSKEPPQKETPPVKEDPPPTVAETPLVVGDDKYHIFATTAFAEYLAMHMLNRAEKIDVSDFNERYNTDALWAACLEAQYQNPLVLGIAGYEVDRSREVLYVHYEQTPGEQLTKQKDLMEEAAKVVKEIIKPGMSALDKELAINNYLCTTAVYDDAALENAQGNDFAFVDPEFYDSFTAYGVLIRKSGVCASYAAAFKLLANEADLPCIVVTGDLYGSLPHAWNRVLVDEDWMSVDATNNVGEELPNVLFNIPDNVAKSVLVENGKFISSAVAASYTGDEENIEYYRLRGLYYAKDEIVEMLVGGLRQNGAVTLRTDYELSDKQFSDIALEVVKTGSFSVDDLYGGHWLGTVYLTIE